MDSVPARKIPADTDPGADEAGKPARAASGHRDSAADQGLAPALDSATTPPDTLPDAPDVVQPPIEESASAVTEEVEVTDTRRKDNPWQKPISNIEIEGLSLQQRDIVDLTTLSEKVLGFFHSESIISSDRFFIRGLGTVGTNPGFDQAVGFSIDGLSLARSRFGRTTFLDLSSVIVYKGTVNEASARNSPAGRLQLGTVDAMPNYEGYISLFQHVDSAPGSALDMASNFRLSDTWAMRLATRVELRDGWVENPSIGESGQQKRDWTLRAKWNGRLEHGVDIELMYQLGVLDRQGRNRELQACLAEQGRDDCTLDRHRYGVPTRAGGNGVGIEFFDTTYHLLAFEHQRQRSRSLSAHLINFATYIADDYYDADQSFVRQDHSLISTRESYNQVDYEYRWESQRDHWFNFRLAARLGLSWLNFTEATILCGDDYDTFGVLRARANCDDSTQPQYSGAQRNVDVSLGEISALYYNRFDFRLSPHWRVELAFRFSLVDKFVDGRAFLSEPWDIGAPLRDPLGTDFVSCVDYVDRRELAQAERAKRQETAPTEIGRQLVCHEPLRQHNLNYGSNNHLQPYLWQPSLSLIWFSQGQTVFLRASHSVKNFGYEIWPIVFGLGFAVIDGLSPLFPEQYMFLGEFTTTYELGGGHSWLRDTIVLEWSAWLSLIDDLQVSNYDAFLQRQYVANAAEASSRGADLELSWVFVSNHRLSVSLAYTLARYDLYTSAPCYENQTPEQGCRQLVPGSEFFDVLGRAQDLSGAPLEYAPRWQYSAGYDGTIALTQQWEMNFSVDYYWRGRHHIGNTYHPVYDVQNPVGTLDARLAFSSEHWQIAVVGRNLTAAYAASFSASDAAHERVSVLGEPSIRLYTAFTRPGRELSLNVKYSW